MRTCFRISSLVPSGLVVESVSDSSDSTILTVQSEAGTTKCPLCGTASRRIHSRYADRWRIYLARVGKYAFGSSRGGDDVVPVRSRRTARLECIVHHLGLALGGRPAANFAKRLMLPVSNDTLLRVVRRRTCPATEPLVVVGIDDWAFRRNHRYGTIVCDLERRRIVALLPVKQWPAGLTSLTLLSEPIIVAIPAEHRLAKRRAIPIAELAPEAFIAMRYMEGSGSMRRSKISAAKASSFPRITQRARQFAAFASLVGTGLGVAFVPKSLGRLPIPGIAYRPLAGTQEMSHLALVFRKSEHAPSVVSFVEKVRRTLRGR